MSTGFVYIMINPAIRGMVKIGRTRRTASARARDLRTTGVPDAFIVVYDELVRNCEVVEKRLQQRFQDFRYQSDREFFQIPIRDAIRALMEEASGFLVPRIGPNSGVEILADLKRKYSGYLKPDIHSIKIVHIDGTVYLETVRFVAGRIDEVVERTDLAMIVEDDVDMRPMFPASRAPYDNARLFVHELDEVSLMQCTELFTADAIGEIERRYAERHNLR